MTWKFLRALRRPPDNDPLFWHSVTGDWATPAPYDAGPLRLRLIWMMLGGLLFLSLCGRSTQNMWIITLFSLLAGSVHGLIAVYQVSGKITEAKARRVYDFLCLTPSGAWRVNWALCTGALHRHNALHAVFILVACAAVFTALHLLSIILRGFEPRADVWSIILLSVTAIPALLLTDYAQSLVIASLIGMIAPTYASNRTEARLVGVAAFLTIQTGAYLLWILLATVSRVNGGGWVAGTIAAALIVSIIRELAVVILTRTLAVRLPSPGMGF